MMPSHKHTRYSSKVLIGFSCQMCYENVKWVFSMCLGGNTRLTGVEALEDQRLISEQHRDGVTDGNNWTANGLMSRKRSESG